MVTANYNYIDDSDGYFPDFSLPFDDHLSSYDGRNLSDAEIALSPLTKEYEKGIYHCTSAKEEHATNAIRTYGINGGAMNVNAGGLGLVWTDMSSTPTSLKQLCKFCTFTETFSSCKSPTNHNG